MKKILTILLVVLTSSFAFAGKYEDAWNETSYNFENLFNEDGFENNQCQESLKDFSACLMALNFLANSLPEALDIELNPNSENRIELVKRESPPLDSESMTDAEIEKEYESAKKKVEQFKNNLEELYNLEAPTSLEPLFTELYAKAKQLEEDIGYIAGQTFSTYVTNAYDPASQVFPESLRFSEPRKYVGMGAEIAKELDKDGEVIEVSPIDIIRPFPGSPAEKAGLKRGDKILAIDGQSVIEMSSKAFVDLVLGEPDTDFTLTVQKFCTGLTEDVVITRGSITQKADILTDSKFVSFKDFTADPKALECSGAEPVEGEPQALYIPLTAFASPNPQSGEPSLFSKFINLQIKDVNNPDSMGIILDLRNNGGGDLNQTLGMLDSVIHSDELLFTHNRVEKGKLVPGEKREIFASSEDSYIVSDMDDDDPTTNEKIFYKKPIVVLINGGSASASEVVAGSLQDFKRGWVVGQKSFGKGSVQTVRPHSFSKPEAPQGGPLASALNQGNVETLIKTTTAIYSLNSGRSPQRVGITPDFWFSPKGEEPTEAEHDISDRSKEFNAITGFENIEWKQNRPELKAKIAECANASDSLSQQYLANMQSGKFPTSFRAFPNYQDLLARDVLKCSFELGDHLPQD